MMTYRMVRTHPAELVTAARDHGPGRYVVDEFAPAGEMLSSGHTSRQWGAIIHETDGTIIPEPHPWPTAPV